MTGRVAFDDQGDREPDYSYWKFDEDKGEKYLALEVLLTEDDVSCINARREINQQPTGASRERRGLVERRRTHNRKVVGSSPGWDCPLWSLGNSIYPTFLTPPRCKWVPVLTGKVTCDGLASCPGGVQLLVA